MTAAEIQAIIDDHVAAISAVVRGGQSYSLNTGQGTTTVTRANLAQLQAGLDYWRAELRGATESDMLSIETGGSD